MADDDDDDWRDWLPDKPEPPDRVLLAVWAVLLGLCLAILLLVGLMLCAVS